MKIILCPDVPKHLLVQTYIVNGEVIVEVGNTVGNVGKLGELLEAIGQPAGRIISFTEEKR